MRRYPSLYFCFAGLEDLPDAERIAKLEDMVVKLTSKSSASNTVDNNGSGGASHKAPNAKTIQSKQTTKTSSEKKDKKVAHKAISSVELKKDNQTHSQLSTLAAAASKSASENPALQKSNSIVVTNQYDKNSVQAVSSPKNQTNKEPQKKAVTISNTLQINRAGTNKVPATSRTKQSGNESEKKAVATSSSGQNNNDSVRAKKESSTKQSGNESENKAVATSSSGQNNNDSKPEMLNTLDMGLNESQNKVAASSSSGQNNNDSVSAKEESSAKQSENKESENKVVVTSGSGPNHNGSKPEMPATMVTVPCKVKNGKWDTITFNYNELATEETCWFDVHLRVQTSFVLHGQFAGDILRLSSEFVLFFFFFLFTFFAAV